MRARNAKRKRTERILRVLIVMLLCAGIGVQGLLIIRLANKNRESENVQAAIDRLSSDVVNYRLTIDSNQNRQALRKQAETKLGMVEPAEDQIRVVHVPSVGTGDAQLAMNNQSE